MVSGREQILVGKGKGCLLVFVLFFSVFFLLVGGVLTDEKEGLSWVPAENQGEVV